MQVIQSCLILVFLLLANSLIVTAQTAEANTPVPFQINLRPDKQTIMLGEPLFIAFEVTNLSGEKVCLSVGGDYRNRFGRPDRFRVSLKHEDGAEVPQLEVIGLGGLVGCESIESGATYTVRLFLSHWATIERTGSYHVNVKRQMDFSAYGDAAFSFSRKPKYSMLADVNAGFTVVPSDENKVGEVINSLGSIMLDISNPRAKESAMALASIQDKRVISYFAEALRKFGDVESELDWSGEGYVTSEAVAALGTYDDDRAIEALQSAMNSRNQDTRLHVATALGDDPHRDAIKLLLQMQDDSYWFVRLRVAQGLKKVNTQESFATLRKLLKDKKEEVRNAARESLDKKER